MLEELDIKNFALIDKAHVEFGKGFTVLSGETGAGKSILIGSLAFVLGGRAGLEQIRSGEHEASVSALFLLESREAFLWLEEHGIEAEENRILLRRVVRDSGKSSAWIGSTPVTRADLADFASFLVDIHGQHEQQSLMKVAEHRRYLDIYAGLTDEVASFTTMYTKLVDKRHLLESLNTNEAERQNKIELLTFAVNEIDEAKIKSGEDEELEAEENKLSSFEKLYGDIEEINSTLGGEQAVLSMLKRLTSTASHALSLDKSLESLDDRLSSSFYELSDIADEFNRYKNTLVYDPQRLEEVQDRLELLYKLKKKYASSPNAPLSEVLDYAENARKQLEQLTGGQADKSVLEAEIAAMEKEVYLKAKDLHDKRSSASQKMSLGVESILSKLGMKETKFRVNLAEKPGDDVTQRCGPYGMDNIEFLIAANLGSPLYPLAKIASGGEISRVMLALKTILASGDNCGTLVFDEIDTGIGGEVAVSLGVHMKELAKQKQILCITHLASIASCADSQIKIQKGLDGQSTSTQVYPVQGQERVKEIARMLSGDVDSQASLEHASSLLERYGGK